MKKTSIKDCSHYTQKTTVLVSSQTVMRIQLLKWKDGKTGQDFLGFGDVFLAFSNLASADFILATLLAW